MNLRFLTCIDLANAIAFNKLWIEMESLEGKKGDDTPDNRIILAVGATDTYIKTQLIDATKSTDTKAQNTAAYATLLETLRLKVLWHHVEWNTNVTIVEAMKNYYIRLDTYNNVATTTTLKAQEALFTTSKSNYVGADQKNTYFADQYKIVRLNTFKAGIKYWMASDSPTTVANADTYFLAFA